MQEQPKGGNMHSMNRQRWLHLAAWVAILAYVVAVWVWVAKPLWNK